MSTSLFSVLSIARDGVLAQTAGLDVTGQNVANASTPGYVKRAANIQARSVPGGSGVQVGGTLRSVDTFAAAQVVEQQGRLSAATARAGALGTAQGILAPPSDDLSSRASAFFGAFAALAQTPSDQGVRAAALAQAGWLAQGFSEQSDALTSERADLFSRAQAVTSEVNDRLKQISTLNQEIVAAQGTGQDTSDLRDTRDRLVGEVGDRIGARTIEDPQGNVTLFAGGSVLVDASKASSLSVSLDASGNLQFLASRDGGKADVTNSIADGSLGGIRESRDTDIPGLVSKLDSFAYDLANAVNAVHASGYGGDGNTGRPLFVVGATPAGAAHALAVDPALAGHPELLAASSTAAGLPGGGDAATAIARVATSMIGSSSSGSIGTPAERFASIASDLGLAVQSANSEQSLRQDTVASATALRESTSGVSIDEEMITLQRYQRGFQASSKVLQTVDGLFDDLMRI